MEENNNEQKNSYTGEYGNSVEGESPAVDSTYRYSYKDNENSATRSGDYYTDNKAGADANNTSDTGSEAGASQYDYIQSTTSQSEQYTNQNQQYNNQNQQFGNQQSGNGQFKQPKKKMGTGKKLLIAAACGLLFGTAAAVCFEGVSYVADRVIGVTNELNAKEDVKIGSVADDNSTDKEQSAPANSSAPKVTGVADVSGVVEQTMPAIVAITSTSEGTAYYDLFGQYYQGSDETSCGSGFIVGQNDNELLIATNNHVISGAKTISVQFIDNEVYEATVKGTDESNDLAVIAVKTKSLKSETLDKIRIADLGNSDDVKVGEMAIAIGNSLGYGQSVTVGYISAKDREITEKSETTGNVNKIKAIQTDAAINPGNSGGALLNIYGQVIGINSAKIAQSAVEGVGYAIPISVANPIIDDLMNREILSDEEKGYIGISGRTVSDQMSVYNMPNGVYVAEVSEGGAAQKAGIQVGDIITSVNNIEVTTIESLQEKVNSYRKGTKVEVIVQRSNNGQYEEKKITVELQGKESLDGLSTQSEEKTPSATQQPDDRNPDSYNGDGGLGDFFSNPFFN